MPIQKRYQPIGTSISYPARVLGVVYQNTTGRPLLVICTAQCLVGQVNNKAYATAFVEAVSPPAVEVASTGWFDWQGTFMATIYGVISFIVPAGYYYMVTGTVVGVPSLVAIFDWCELSLIEPFSAGF